MKSRNNLLARISEEEQLVREFNRIVREEINDDRDRARLRRARLPRSIGKPRKKACGYAFE